MLFRHGFQYHNLDFDDDSILVYGRYLLYLVNI